MQPALAEVVQYSIFPGSTATTGARLSPSRSLPWCFSPPRGSPKSSVYATGPTTGKRIRGTALVAVAAVAAASTSATRIGARDRIAHAP